MDFETKLQDFGLSEKEAKVYLTLLELGESSASDIAKGSGVNRATTYVVLDSLKEIGLVSTYDQGGTTQYVASDPSRLQNIVEDKKEEWTQKYDELNSLLPELQSLHNAEENKPAIRFFEGEEGVLESYKEFLSSKQTEDGVKYFYSKDKIEEIMSKDQRNQFIEARKGRNVGAEAILSREKQSPDSEGHSHNISVNPNDFPISIDLEIYGDSIFISTLEDELSAILIKNQNIADSFKTLFRLAQIGAKAEQEDNTEE